jgi:hypothetical protein
MQVVRGGELNFSFARFAPMAVVYRTPRRPPWTGRLEWRAERVKPKDFDHFNYALVPMGRDMPPWPRCRRFTR